MTSVLRHRIFGKACPLIAACIALLLSGCATIPREAMMTEPSGLLEMAPQLYVRLSGAALRDMRSHIDDRSIATIMTSYRDESAASGSGSQDLAFLETVLSRTRTLGFGLSGLGPAHSGVGATSEMVLIGDFKPLSLRIALAVDGKWRKTGDGGFVSTQYPLYIREPAPGIVHISTIEKGKKRSIGEANIYPSRYIALAKSDIFISTTALNEIFSIPMPMEAASIPVIAMVAAGYAMDEGSRYTLEFRILMRDEASARLYRPVVRFLWVGAATRLLGEGSPAAMLSPVLEGDEYIVRGIEVTGRDLKDLLLTNLSALN
ncbi:MAG: hypothetical protein FD137_359 [Spirochaetes bacterium]|nr:MAG: hypothetical protein FD137_359 [Spirochaetota bacterium]